MAGALQNDRDAMTRSRFEFRADSLLRHITADAFFSSETQDTTLSESWRRGAARFVGGATLDDCLEVAQKIRGFGVAIDYIGENAKDDNEIERETRELVRIVKALDARHLVASLYFDLSQIGLSVDQDLFFENMVEVAQAAGNAGLEIIINTDRQDHIDKILEMHEHVCYHFQNVGVSLQAHLNRTAADLTALMKRPGRIRLVKGESDTSSEFSSLSSADVYLSYCSYMETLLLSRHACTISTHDAILLHDAHTFIEHHNLTSDQIEFEVPYGIATDRLLMMQGRGYHTRISIPYGPDWYMYFSQRLEERVHQPTVLRVDHRLRHGTEKH